MFLPVALPAAPPMWIWSYSSARNFSSDTEDPPAQTSFVLPAALTASLRSSADAAPSFLGALTLTKSLPRHAATPAAPAIKCGSFSSLTALPRG